MREILCALSMRSKASERVGVSNTQYIMDMQRKTFNLTALRLHRRNDDILTSNKEKNKDPKRKLSSRVSQGPTMRESYLF